MDIFIEFLNKLHSRDNVSILESIQEGYKTIFEAESFEVGKHKSGTFDEMRIKSEDGEILGSIIYERDFPNKGELNIEYLEVPENQRRKGYAEKLIQKLKQDNPEYKLSGRSTNEKAEALNRKLGVFDRTVNDRAELVREFQEGIRVTKNNIANNIGNQIDNQRILNIQEMKLEQILKKYPELKPNQIKSATGNNPNILEAITIVEE